MTGNNIPLWTKNKYILTGYRCQTNKLSCLISIFNIHNETINIWTHMISLIYFVYILIINNNNNIIIKLYEIVSIISFTMSTCYHTYMPMSQKNYLLLLKLDLFSIILNIVTSNILIYYYWFWCYKILRNIYMFFSGLYLGIGIIILLKIDIIKKHNYILAYYSIYNVGIIISYIHIYNLTDGDVDKIIKYNFTKPMKYFITGFIIYTIKIPERLFSKKFDIIGNSHQLWHILCSFGIYYYHEEIIKNIEYRKFDRCYYCVASNASVTPALTLNSLM